MSPTDPIQLAEHEAVELAYLGGIEELMAGAADPEVGADVLADLLAHELVSMHRLAMRLSGAAQGVLDWSVERDAAAQEAARRTRPSTPPIFRQRAWPASPAG